MFILIIKQKASISCITRQNGMFWQLSKISRMFQVPGFGAATGKEEALGILSLEVPCLSDGWGRPCMLCRAARVCVLYDQHCSTYALLNSTLSSHR